jgi:hypothetical protein
MAVVGTFDVTKTLDGQLAKANWFLTVGMK